MPALHSAALKGDSKTVAALLEQGEQTPQLLASA
jgi:hypothetical protein